MGEVNEFELIKGALSVEKFKQTVISIVNSGTLLGKGGEMVVSNRKGTLWTSLVREPKINIHTHNYTLTISRTLPDDEQVVKQFNAVLLNDIVENFNTWILQHYNEHHLVRSSYNNVEVDNVVRLREVLLEEFSYLDKGDDEVDLLDRVGRVLFRLKYTYEDIEDLSDDGTTLTFKQLTPTVFKYLPESDTKVVVAKGTYNFINYIKSLQIAGLRNE